MGAEKKNVVVGIGGEKDQALLVWALEKVADPGDNVVALHICPSSARLSKEKALMDSYIEEYSSFCTHKQVFFSAQIFKGKSYRKVLVREAKKHNACTVIVGISKHRAIRGWSSIAKYCIRKLPVTTDVIAVYNGKKIIFRRPSSSSLTFEGKCEAIETYHTKGNIMSKKSIPEPQESEASKRCGYHSDGEVNDLKAEEEKFSIVGQSKRRSLTAISIPVDNFRMDLPGWPLLLRTSSLMTRTIQNARKMSVVRWVMSLPCRSSPDVRTLSSPTCGADQDSWESKSEVLSEMSPREVNFSQEEVYKDLKLIPIKSPFHCEVFSYCTLRKATSEFSSGNLIGTGGCNSVYKGILPDGKKIAAKVMLSSKAAHKDFAKEVDIMTTIKHKRITPFLGICIENNKLISVYELLQQGNLEQNLQGNEKEKTSLPWEVRFKIAHGVAEVLDYLHNANPNPVIHRDVKSSNILLTEELEPQLSDFGLAIWGPQQSSFLMDNDLVGTFGYLAPEYFMYGRVSEKIDVYAYGVVLLELLSGRKPISSVPKRDQQSLVMWAKPKLKSADISSILDPNLDGKFDNDQVQKLALAAKLCLDQAATHRPRMKQILQVLDGNTPQIDIDNDHFPKTCDDDNDEELYPDSSAESHLTVAFHDVNEDTASSWSSPLSVEDYLQKRWIRSPSLD